MTDWSKNTYDDEELIAALDAKLEYQGECLVWTGESYPEHNGIKRLIGRLKIQRNRERRSFLVHRLMWEVANRELLTGEDEIVRTCRNGLCARPEHLMKTDRYGTARSMSRRGTLVTTGAKKYSHEDILHDREHLGLSYRELMDKYNIKSRGTISYIINKSMASNPSKEDSQ